MLKIIRQIQQDIQDVHQRERGRLLVLTGARQVGKCDARVRYILLGSSQILLLKGANYMFLTPIALR